MIAPKIDVPASPPPRSQPPSRDSNANSDQGQNGTPFGRILAEQTSAAQDAGQPSEVRPRKDEAAAPDPDSGTGTSPDGSAAAVPGWQAILAQMLAASGMPQPAAPDQSAKDAPPQPAPLPASLGQLQMKADAAGAPTDDVSALPAEASIPDLHVLAGKAASRETKAKAEAATAAASKAAAFDVASLDGATSISGASRAPVLGQEGQPDGQPSQNQSGHARRGLAAVEDLRTVDVQSVSSATHYPVSGDPVRQIASEITREIGATTSAAAGPDASANAQGPTKTLNVQLEPESLGTVTIRLRLTGARLSVQLDVARPETLEMITRSQDTLHKSLDTDKCRLETLTIRAAAAADAPVASQGSSGSNQQSGNQQSNASANQNASAFNGERSRDQRDRQDSPRKTQNEDLPVLDRSASVRGLYL